MNGKYYLGFIFDEAMTDGIHCTHMYFGELALYKRDFVIEEVNRFFSYFGPIYMPVITFDTPAVFGPEGEKVPALVPYYGKGGFKQMNKIRQFFESARMIDTFQPFYPHVTIKRYPNTTRIDSPFTHYALISGRTVIEKWKIHTDPPTRYCSKL